MDLKELESNLVMNGLNIMVMNARMNALEDIVFGFLNVELEDREQGASKENKRLFLEFFLENLAEYKKQLPAFVGHSQFLEMKLKETELRTKQEIENLFSYRLFFIG
jgi:hypothetical protein